MTFGEGKPLLKPNASFPSNLPLSWERGSQLLYFGDLPRGFEVEPGGQGPYTTEQATQGFYILQMMHWPGCTLKDGNPVLHRILVNTERLAGFL